jgi:hypothetical protein
MMNQARYAQSHTDLETDQENNDESRLGHDQAPEDAEMLDGLLPGLSDEDQDDDPVLEPSSTNSDIDLIGRKELHQIQVDISVTTRPRWQSGPPPKFGTKAAGKLKADQWRSCIEFDIPISLVKLWSTAGQTEENVDGDRRRKLLHSTMLLATAIRWVATHRTSSNHAVEYMRNMRAYLRSLRDLFPHRDLLPNHHNALYIGEMLLRFGPLYGWWMFPFERVIGLLQQINTNQKIGTKRLSTKSLNNR